MWYFGFFLCPFSFFLGAITWKDVSVGQPAGRGDTNSPIQDNGTAGWIWVLLLAERDDCQRHAVHYGRVLIFTQLTQFGHSSVVLLLLGDKMELSFCAVFAMEWAKWEKKDSALQCLVSQRSILPPAKISAMYQGRDLRGGGQVLHSSRKAQSLCECPHLYKKLSQQD